MMESPVAQFDVEKKRRQAQKIAEVIREGQLISQEEAMYGYGAGFC